jgi:O-antigen chain-terminating methyltransferase
MDTETNSEEIDVEKIMGKIQDSIKKKEEQGIYSNEDTEMVNTGPFMKNNDPWDDMNKFLNDLNLCWDPRKDSPITTHRIYTGPLVVFIKKVMRKILKFFRIPNLLLSRQAAFNFQVLKAINYLTADMPVEGSSLSKKIYELKRENTLLRQRLDLILAEIEKKYDLPEQAAVSIVREKNRTENHNYLLFENKFRGDREEIKKRLEFYLPLFKKADNVLDIGCGRGEFLEMLNDQGINATGIDTNEAMVSFCNEIKLKVQQAEAITYLSSVSDTSLGGLIASHVIEHFRNDLLYQFAKLCFLKLKNGASIVFETPNPLSIVVSATNFHLDLSHVKPLHPETVKFLLESNGFTDVHIHYLSPFPDDMKFKFIKDSFFSSKKKTVDQLNKNFQKLNDLLYGYQDYAVIGKK